MNLLSLRDRIRTKAIANSLTYTEIETLFDVNELLNQTMPCLAWRYSGETNNFDEVGTEMSLNIYLLTEFPDSVKTETADYQRDYIVTQQDALRTFFYTWLQAMPFESGSDFLEVLSTEEIPIAERLSINAFLTMEFRVNISIKRDFCVEPEEIAPTADEVKVYFNSVLKYTQACNVDLELTLKNQDGDDITAAFTGYDIVVNQPVAADARVSNSDDTYDVNVASGGDLELPDITISNSDNSYSVTSPSVKDIDLPNITLANSDGSLTASIPSAQDVTITDVTISNSDSSYSASSPYNPNLSVPDITVSNSDNSYSVTSPSVIDVDIPDEAITLNSAAFITKPSKKDQDILLKDVSGNTITPEALSGNTITILDAVVGGAKGLRPLQTGATTSYATGDDGDLERGRLVNLLTLPYNNGFGGTQRFTDELGGQTFTKNIIIDWSTWDGGTDVLGYIFTFRSTSHNGTKSWSDWMSGQPYTTDGFSNWNVVNTNEVLSLYDITTTNGLDYAPFSNTTSNSFWTSLSLDGVKAFYNNRNSIFFRKSNLSTTLQSMFVRTFNWNGTTLS